MVYDFQVLMVVMMLVECTHQAMVVIICLAEMMYAYNLLWLITNITILVSRLIHLSLILNCRLVVALTHQCTLVVVLVEAVIWVQVVLAHTIEVICLIVLYCSVLFL